MPSELEERKGSRGGPGSGSALLGKSPRLAQEAGPSSPAKFR